MCRYREHLGYIPILRSCPTGEVFGVGTERLSRCGESTIVEGIWGIWGTAYGEQGYFIFLFEHGHYTYLGDASNVGIFWG